MSGSLNKLAVAAAVAGLSASLFIGSDAQAQTVVFGVAPPVVGVQIRLAPPPLPVYVQPPCPVVGYMWTPGYWAYGPAGYYWVPGTWVAPPAVGLLWTPGYWGWIGGIYSWHAGYWGPHVGFYGGVNYGFGYGGMGFAGGRWVGGSFAYNAAVTNVNVNIIHNTYRETVVNNFTTNHVSFNGGPGGIRAMPTAQERMAEREQHFAPTVLQQRHVQQAERNPALAARANGGHPGIAATARPGQFRGAGVVAARGAPAMNHAEFAQHAANHPGNPYEQAGRGQEWVQRQAREQPRQAPNERPRSERPQQHEHPYPQARPQEQHRGPAPRQEERR